LTPKTRIKELKSLKVTLEMLHNFYLVSLPYFFQLRLCHSLKGKCMAACANNISTSI